MGLGSAVGSFRQLLHICTIYIRAGNSYIVGETRPEYISFVQGHARRADSSVMAIRSRMLNVLCDVVWTRRWLVPLPCIVVDL